ncbi:MAG: hypothetical protein ACK5L5_05485 [Bacteroidales bacterium]
MDLKQILSLYRDGVSNCQIGKLLGISRNTINTYVAQFKSCTQSIDELLELEELQLSELFTTHTTLISERYDELMSWFEQINQARNHPGFTYKYHYQAYSSQVKQPYGYTQFMEHYHRKYAKEKGSMKLAHEAGKEMYVDFAGKRLEIMDKATGEIKKVEVFVAILPNSQYTYVEACKSQK